MPWCPKCKNEYYEGIKACADCGSELVDSLEEWEAAERETEEAKLQVQLAAYRAMLAQEEEEYGEEAEDAESFEGAETPGAAAASKIAGNASRGVYQDYEEKAADNKSSAYTLLGAGAAGLAAIALNFFGVVTLPLYSSTRYIIWAVMGAMFLFFLVMGVISMKNAGKYAKKAESEKELTRELEKWFEECVTAEKIDEGLFAEEEEELGEEQKYFKRFERMKELLCGRFLNLDEGYVDRFVDQHYQDVFVDQP